MVKGKFLDLGGEFSLIEKLRKNIKIDKSIIKGIGDDCAVIPYKKNKVLLLTCDMLIEDVHFKIKEITPFWIGWKALGSSLSDIAAMGGKPLYALISLGVPKKLTLDFANKIYLGIKKIAKIFEINILGGDTNRSSKLIIDIFLVGEGEKERVIYRNGAKTNDYIGLTGRLGNSYKSGRHFRFLPRIKEANFLTHNFKINSMIDVSDGLSSDLYHILRESKKGAIVFAKDIPLHRGATLEQAFNEGEDFELLFTLPPEEARDLSKKKINFPITFIGKIIESPNKIFLYEGENKIREIFPKGFSHF